MDDASTAILLAEDSPSDAELVRRSLRKGHVNNPLEVAPDGQVALERLRGPLRFGLLILDIHLPKVNGLEVLKEAKRIDPELVVIMLTSKASFQTAVQSLRREGAFDYVEKSKDDLPNLVEAVRLALKQRALRADPPLSVGSKTGSKPLADMSAVKARFNLSDREVDVIKCLCGGATNKEIGQRLFISELTVKGHLKNIYQKMNAHTRAGVVSLVLANATTAPTAPPPSQLLSEV